MGEGVQYPLSLQSRLSVGYQGGVAAAYYDSPHQHDAANARMVKKTVNMLKFADLLAD